MICFITGASRGFGKAFAIEIATVLKGPLKLVLCSRNNDKLVELRDELFALRNPVDTVVELIVSDLSDLNSIDGISQNFFNNRESAYTRHIFLNNAGSLGPLNTVTNLTDIRDFRSVIDFNITSSIYLTSQFVRYFAQFSDSEHRGLVVNVSSLCAIQPFATWSLYCAGKAARELFSRVLSQELSTSAFQVLNYAPGPLDTDMQKEIRECEGCDAQLHTIFETMHSNNSLVSPSDSAKVLVDLALNMFSGASVSPKSGDHVDYFDCISRK